MKTIKYLIEKEFKQMFRNPLIPMLILLFPPLVLLIFPWTMSFEIKNIRIDVVDHSKSTYSKRLTDKIGASQYFILHDVPLSFEEAMRNIERGETDMVMEIPSSFDKDLVKNASSQVSVTVNSVNGTEGLLGSNYVMQIVNDFSTEIRHELLGTLPPGQQMQLMQMPVVEIAKRFKYNPGLDYKHFMIPGFMVLLLTIICGILPALNIVAEKEVGTINQINVTPVSKMGFILAKLIPFWIVGFLVLVISILVALLMYGMWPLNGIWGVLLSGLIFIISVSGMGIIISNYSETMQQASFLVMFFILVIILLSGLFTPVSSMPGWAQFIAYVNPFTYLTHSLRLLYLNGSNIADISSDLLKLVAFAVVLNGWAILSYRKRG